MICAIIRAYKVYGRESLSGGGWEYPINTLPPPYIAFTWRQMRVVL